MDRLPCFVALSLALILGVATAHAKPAVCFPERVVMRAAWIRDDQGRIVAGVRSGREVRVIEEGSDDRAYQSLIEVVGPMALRGWAKRTHLLVLARRDLETVTGTEWWLAEAPLRVYGGDAQSASVVCAECTGIFASKGDELNVPCAALRGTLPAEVMRTDCNGARGKTTSTSAGQPVHALANGLTIDLASGAKYEVGSGGALYLLERQGARAKVEQLDWHGWTRIRGWLDANRVEPDSSQLLGWGSSGCAGEFDDPVLPRGLTAKLRREVTMTSALDGGMVTPLPAESPVEILGRFDDRLFALWRQLNAQGVATLVVVGWIPREAVKEAGRLPSSIRGRLRRPTRQATPSWDELQVTMRSGLLRFTAQPDAQGRFRMPVAVPDGASSAKAANPPSFDSDCSCFSADETTYIHSESRDGLWTGSVSLKNSPSTKSVVLDIARAAPGK